MKTRIKILLCFALFPCVSFAHQQVVHEAITINAAAATAIVSFDYNDFLNTVSSDYNASEAIEQMKAGSFDEDFQDEPGDVGGIRSYNHFYDPLTGQGLSDYPLISDEFNRRITMGTNSFSWASISNCVGLNFNGYVFGKDANLNTSNIWSWQNVRGYEMAAFLGVSPTTRSNNFNNMFRALGQVMHLLQDTSQPQHVRNEQHWDKEFSPWKSYIEAYGAAHVGTLNYGDGSMLDWRGLGFTDMQNFWDRNLYTTNNSQSQNSQVLDNDANGGTQLGLAEFGNANFLGERHLYGEFYSPGNIAYYPFPSLYTSTDYRQKKANLASLIDVLTLKNGYQGNSIYLSKTGDGVPVTHHSRMSYLGAKFPNQFGAVSTTTKDDNVDNDYLNILIPKAVEYSAGLLDYYFRGTIGVSVSGTTITIRNTSGQDFNGGSFLLLVDDTNGIRSYVDQFTLSGTLPSLSATNVTEGYLSGLVDPTTKFTLVYQGTIGVTNGTNALDPVDAGIGIATKTFTTTNSSGNNCDGNPASLSGFNWTTIPGEIFGIAPASSEGITTSGASISFSQGGIYALTANLANPGPCSVTINMSAHFTWEPGSQPAFWFGTNLGFIDYYYPSWSIWTDGPGDGGTADPQFSITIPPGTTPVYFFFLANGGFSGYLSFSY